MVAQWEHAGFAFERSQVQIHCKTGLIIMIFQLFWRYILQFLIWGFTYLTNADVEALIETWHIQLLFQGKISTNFTPESKSYFMNVAPTFWKKLMNESVVMWQQHLTVTQRFQVQIQMVSPKKISQKTVRSNSFFQGFHASMDHI